MGSNQFFEEAVHDLTLGVEFDLAHQLASVFHQFSNAGLVGITDVKGGLGDFFGDFVVEVFVLDHEILGGARTPDDDGLNVLKVGQPVGRGVFGGPLEEIVRSFLNESLESLSRLTALAVLAHDV